MSELEEMIQPQEINQDLSSPEELEVINVEETPLSDNNLKALKKLLISIWKKKKRIKT